MALRRPASADFAAAAGLECGHRIPGPCPHIVVHEYVAALDLGSNSFRLQVGRVVGNQIYPLDGLKETVRLAAGLTADKQLDAASQQHALAALARFAERLRGFAPQAVRAVATNALRVAKNAPQFVARAEATLGFPIEVISGREEARLIYLGVAHTLAQQRSRLLAVDIGGGSTEFIIGRNMRPLCLESLYMGCVSHSLRYFPHGRIDKRSMKEAELAARRELQAIVQPFRSVGWDLAVGSSGTAKAICEVLEANRLATGAITRDGLEALRAWLVRAGNAGRTGLAGLRPDRAPVFAGGVAIMAAIFKEFDLAEMVFSEGALRLGVLYDLLGRYHHEDLREATVQHFMQRYEVDRRQAERVAQTALACYRQLRPRDDLATTPAAQLLRWAALLHEIGISIAHASYHKHSAYILANADMPGFSKREQALLARLVLAQRGKLERVQPLAGEPGNASEWLLIFCLRCAALLHRARDDMPLPELHVRIAERRFQLGIDRDWLAAAPLTAANLAEETQSWAQVGLDFRVRGLSLAD